MSDNTEAQEREAFEAWCRTRPGHPFAGAFTTLMRAAWLARAALAQQAATPAPAEPLWYAVMSKSAPVINRAVRRADVADEEASRLRETHRDVEVIPLYAAPLATPAAQWLVPAGPVSDASIYEVADRFGHRFRTADEEGMQFDRHALLDFARAVGVLFMPSEAPATPAAPPAAQAEPPNGWKLVPVEPTEDMKQRGQRALDKCNSARDAYDAMLAAAPAPAAQAEPIEMTCPRLNQACWSFVEAMPHRLPGPIFNDLKPALKAAIERYLADAPAAQAGDALPPPADVSLGQIAYKGFDAYWHEGSEGIEADAWEAAAQAVVAALAARGQAGEREAPYSLYVARSAIEAALSSTPERVSVPYAYDQPQADNDVAMIFRRAARGAA